MTDKKGKEKKENSSTLQLEQMKIEGQLKRFMSDVEIAFHEAVMMSGGYVNGHAHIDRCNTNYFHYWTAYSSSFDPYKAASLPLDVKQDITGEMHKGEAYTWDNLIDRMGKEIERQYFLGHRKLITHIDATPDLLRWHDDPLIAVKAALKLKKQYKDLLDMQIFAHPVFGFKADEDDAAPRLEVFHEAVKIVDGVGGLPERDEKISKRGYTDHVVECLKLGLEHNKPVQIHVDQGNSLLENGTERVIQAVHCHDATCLRDKKGNKTSEPLVWLVHSISPSCYDETRFKKVVEGLAENNIGIIVCPSAALGMRQLRSLQTPTHNSIARILELLIEGVRIKIGTDNIEDVFMAV